MICLSCRGLSSAVVCGSCRSDLRGAADRWLTPGVLVRSAYLHNGSARRLVHRLKYDGLAPTAAVMATAMAPLVGSAGMLVPVPRTVVRRHRFGVDPARELAMALSRLTGVPTVTALSPALTGRVHAGRRSSDRTMPGFTLRCAVPVDAVLIDDVITTGGTLRHAAQLLGVGMAVTATSRILDSSWSADRPKP